MRKALVLIMVVAMMCTFYPADSHAGPWTLDQGKIWLEIFGRYFHASRYFDSKYQLGKWENGGWSSIFDVEGKLEYGVTNTFNLILGIPYSWSQWRNDWGKVNADWGHFKNEGFKSINFGFKYRLTLEPLVSAVQLKAFIQPRGQDINKQPELSEYGDALELRGLLGQSWKVFDGNQMYFSSEAGYLWRSKRKIASSKYANAIPILVEGGFAPLDWLMCKGEIDCYISHAGTGTIKDTYTWRAGPIISILGRGFSSIQKGENFPEQKYSLNVELQYGQTFLGRGDPGDRWDYNDRVSAAQEFVCKVQLLF